MILINLKAVIIAHKAVSILPSGSVYRAIRGKKEWQNNLSKAFAVDGSVDTTSHRHYPM